MRCWPDEPYITPPGMVDQPYCFVFPGSGLTNGTDYKNLDVAIATEADFILRRIAGLDLMASATTGNILYRDAIERANSASPHYWKYDFLVVPEKYYPSQGYIRFDLYGTSVATKTDGALASLPYGQLVWQGVKRYSGDVPYPAPSPYPYYGKPYTYRFALNLNFYGLIGTPPFPANAGVAAPQIMWQEVADYDFELHEIAIIDLMTNAPSQANIAMTLYDPRERMLSSAPVVDLLLQSNDSLYSGVVPVPAVLYPRWSNIRFDVQSLAVQASDLRQIEIDFIGVQRRPCQ